jgi:hypothetical protein
MGIQTINELARKIAQDPELEQKIKDNPVNALAELASPILTDKWIYRIVVVALGSLIIISIVGALYLTSQSTATYEFQVPDAVLALGSTAIGALAGLLVPPPS